MRLNRYLAAAGLGSRRSVEAIILEGRVRINGRYIEDLGTVVNPGDVVKVGNRVVQVQEVIHAVLYKPRGFLCTASDERERRTIFDLLPPDWPRVYHVGRLDMESEGLLVVTNDGDLSMALTHPKFKIEKEYEVTLDKPFNPEHRDKLLRGFHIEGGRAKMEEVDILSPLKLRVVLAQGIKRQIRIMLYDCGYEVENLRRVRIGSIWIDKLRAGMWRMLSPKDVSDLKAGRSARRKEEPARHRDDAAARPAIAPKDEPRPENAPVRPTKPARPARKARPKTDSTSGEQRPWRRTERGASARNSPKRDV